MKVKMQVELRSIDELIPYAKNARTHDAAQVDKIAASMKEYGWTNPILLNGSAGVLAGHGRILAARKLRDAGQSIPNLDDIGMVPTIDLGHLTEAQQRAYVLADNATALAAGWDEGLLAAELADLQLEDFPLELTGFDPAEIERLLAKAGATEEGLTDPDDVPEAPETPVTVLGDVWIMGRHRIICGSSTEADVVAKVLNGVKPHLMVTDPPYGVEYDASFRNGIKRADGSMVGERATGKVLNDDKADWREAWALFPGDVAYVWHAGVHAGTVAESLIACDFSIRSQIIWAKSQFAIGRGDYHWQHEPAWYCVRKNKTGHYNGDRKQSTLWQIPKPLKSETGHSTQKPVECMKRPIENNSSPGQAVYEPFSGSGTTIIAAEQTGRCCYAIELNPPYVDVAVQRWSEFVGKQAILEGDGRTFDEIKAERLGGAVAQSSAEGPAHAQP